jgi:hypothetical protein
MSEFSSPIDGRVCAECGYDLRGLPGHCDRCPECGHVVTDAVSRDLARLRWARSVAAGLLLLMGLTIYGIETVLVQPFTTEFAGMLPSLNYPGPKLWAVPLAQRPIGNRPELPGVIGSRTALLSLIAIWMITVRRSPGGAAAPTPAGDTCRLALRWVSVVAFGTAFGVMAARHGLWPAELVSYRTLLVAAVEFPCTALLYWHLWYVAARVPGRDRRLTFARLRWWVPMVMLAGLAMTFAGILGDGKPKPGAMTEQIQTITSAIYGILSIGSAAAGIAVVGSLALSLAACAFPAALRSAGAARQALLATRRAIASAVGDARLRIAAVIAGLMLLIVCMLLGNEMVLWYHARIGVAGSLPFFNYPGPKVWATAIVPELGGAQYWNELRSTSLLALLNITAVWLLTLRIGPDAEVFPEPRLHPRPDLTELLRLAARWSAVLAVGAAAGCVAGWQALRSDNYYLREEGRGKFFAIALLTCELPATLLLYWHLAATARRLGHAMLADRIKRATVAILMLMGGALLAFAVSRRFANHRADTIVIAMCGAYGAAQVLVAIRMTALLATLAGILLRCLAKPAAPPTTAQTEPAAP